MRRVWILTLTSFSSPNRADHLPNTPLPLQSTPKSMQLVRRLFLLPLLIVLQLGTFNWTRLLALADYSLTCNPGYRVSALQRVNSPRQRGKIGSISIECQPIPTQFGGGGKIETKCEALETAPQCNGLAEGCTGSQWIGGFNVYKLHNGTNAILLDPICCASPEVFVDQVSCASERLNAPKLPFEHSIVSSDFIYRGLQCWQQFDLEGTVVDLIWKLEICQIRSRRKGTNGTSALGSMPGPENCPPCECHCGINLCGSGDEPIRVIHKNFLPNKCACDCICRYECIE